jgi:hypothetical protein
VKEFKRSLAKSADTVSNLTYDTLVTYLTRAEGILNHRPLTIDDDLRVLTPAHLLSPSTETGFAFSSEVSFSRVLGQLRQAVKHFWTTWSRQYMAMMSADRLLKTTAVFVNLQVGDKVLIRANYNSSNVFAKDSWLAAEVTKTHFSADGAIRRVTVKTADDDIKELTIDKIYIAEGDAFERRQRSGNLQTYDEPQPTIDARIQSDVHGEHAQGGVSDPGTTVVPP